MKILITGAGGMLGNDLARCLDQDFEVYGVGRSPAEHLTIPYYQINLLDEKKLIELAEEIRPDLVFHAAAMTRVDACETERDKAYEDNVRATQHLVRAANRSGAHVLLTSTDYVFDGRKSGEYREDDAVSPVNAYGESKLQAEVWLREHAERYSIFRMSWLYGRQGRSFPRTMLEKAGSQATLDVVQDQRGRPTYTLDLAEGFRRLFREGSAVLNRLQGQIFHVGNSGAASWAEFAVEIFRCAGLDPSRIRFVDSSAFPTPAKRPSNSILALEKAGKVLGYELRSWKEAIADFVKELKETSFHE